MRGGSGAGTLRGYGCGRRSGRTTCGCLIETIQGGAGPTRLVAAIEAVALLGQRYGDWWPVQAAATHRIDASPFAQRSEAPGGAV